MEKMKNDTRRGKSSGYLIAAAVLILAAILCLAFFLTYLKSFSRLPWYTYRDFTWSSSSGSIAYLRTPHFTDETDRSRETSHELWVCGLSQAGRRSLVTLNAEPDSLRILGWTVDDSSVVLSRLVGGRYEIYYVGVGSNRVTRYDINIPCIESVFFDKGDLYICSTDAERTKKTIGRIDSDRPSFDELMVFEMRELAELELLSVKQSGSGDRCAFAIYYRNRGDEEGKASIWIYCFNEKKAINIAAQSCSRDISFDWSPNDNVIAASIAEMKEGNVLDRSINFFIPETYEKSQNLTPADGSLPFQLFWNSRNQLFILVKNRIYLMLLDPDRPYAKTLFSWDSIGYIPSEFHISPDGTRIVFNTAFSTGIVKEDAYIMNIDGTDLHRIIEPEGRRSIECNAVYKAFAVVGKVLNDFQGSIKKNTGR
jgi:hypothetical protein